MDFSNLNLFEKYYSIFISVITSKALVKLKNQIFKLLRDLNWFSGNTVRLVTWMMR